MSTLRPHALVPCILIFAGIVVLTSASPASAREHAAGAMKPPRHHVHDTRGVHRAAHRLTPEADGSAARHHSPRVADHATQHRARRVARHEGAHEGAHGGFSGFASYYSEGRRVASGGAFNSSGYTCAHRTLPFGTHLRVADPRSGRSVVVTVNDRGPFVRGRVLDLSLGAARALGMTGRGIMRISASVI